ncbi:ABC transporter permease [Candidatus Saccharibacteria bacterium]|nr:ABC transporter permease [Candidatus Saccharibacteria bacterium]
MALLLKTHFDLAKASLKRNRTRSFLTCLGIAIGVASIILILSLTGSIENLIKTQVSGIGADLIVVRPSVKKDVVSDIVEELTSSNAYLKSNLTLDDVKSIKSLENIESVAPLAISVNSLSGTSTVPSATIVGTNSDFLKIQNLALKSGVFLPDDKNKDAVVVGSSLATALFGNTEPIGKTLTFLGTRFIVIGVLSKVDDPINFNNLDLDNTLFINAEKLKSVSDSLQIQQINIRAKTTANLEQTVEDIAECLKLANSGDTNFTVSYGDNITHPAGSLLSIVSGILSIVASISLVVGGIGVMNIMLVSVSERTHEIGVRKAVGASASNIMFQFLFESLILSVFGSIFGLVLGYGLAFAVCLVTPFDPFVSWEILLTALVTAFSVGLIFGLYPALKAANKNPIYSLKFFR